MRVFSPVANPSAAVFVQVLVRCGAWTLSSVGAKSWTCYCQGVDCRTNFIIKGNISTCDAVETYCCLQGVTKWML